MKIFWTLLSAIDAAFAIEAFYYGRYGWGIYLVVLSTWAMLLAVNIKEKTNDETPAS